MGLSLKLPPGIGSEPKNFSADQPMLINDFHSAFSGKTIVRWEDRVMSKTTQLLTSDHDIEHRRIARFDWRKGTLLGLVELAALPFAPAEVVALDVPAVAGRGRAKTPHLFDDGRG
ncbi:hypothetical protein ACVWZ4_000700 [Bradyrhizobium sp. USDA 4472]